MIISIYLFVIVLNLILAYEKKNSNFVMIISYIVIMILMCGYRRPFYSDLDNYFYMYIGQQDLPIGMDIIFKIFKGFGVDFYTVHYVLLGIFNLICIYVIKTLCDNWHFALALLSGYYIIISADQIKNHTAFIFLYIAILCLYKNKRIKAIVFIALATSIHYSFVVYFLFVILSSKKSKKAIRFYIALSMIYTIAAILKLDSMFVNRLIPTLISIFGAQIGTFAESKVQLYLTTRTRGGFILCIGFQLLNYCMLRYSRKLTVNHNATDHISLVDYVIKLNEIGFLSIPLFVYNMQWYRIIRDLLLINYCVYGNTYFILKKNTKCRLIYLILSVSSVYMWLIGDLCLKSSPNLVIIPFFSNNIFL